MQCAVEQLLLGDQRQIIFALCVTGGRMAHPAFPWPSGGMPFICMVLRGSERLQMQQQADVYCSHHTSAVPLTVMVVLRRDWRRRRSGCSRTSLQGWRLPNGHLQTPPPRPPH
jgi:hypothetical protein